MSLINKKILFIVEGESAEAKITKNLAENILELSKEEYYICVFNTSIYELFQELQKDAYIDIVNLLVEKYGLSMPEGTISKTAFSQIYLFFDYEPNYQKYKDENIRELLNMFDNETENGKLYINYPMVEAIFYLDDFNKPTNIVAKKKLDECFSRKFKKETKGITCYKNKNNVAFDLHKKEHIYNAIKWNYIIYCKICKKKVKDFNQIIDYSQLLNVQIDLKNKTQYIYVIGTLVFLIIDYNPNILYEIDKKISIASID